MTTLDAMQDRIARARERAEVHQDNELVRELDELQEMLAGEVMLTTTEAAQLLGIRSVNTIKALAHAGRIKAHKVGSHYRIPLAEIARLQEDKMIQGLQASGRLWAELEAYGPDREMTDEEMRILSESRPGTLPWKRTPDPAQEDPAGETERTDR